MFFYEIKISRFRLRMIPTRDVKFLKRVIDTFFAVGSLVAERFK